MCLMLAPKYDKIYKKMKRLSYILFLFGFLCRPALPSATFDMDLAKELDKAVRTLCERLYKFHTDNGDNPGFDKVACQMDSLGEVMEKMQLSMPAGLETQSGNTE